MIHEPLLHRPTPPAQQPSLSHDCTTLCKQSTYSVSARPTSPGTTLSPRRIMACPTSSRKTRPDRNGLRVENHMHPQLTLKLIHMRFLCVL
jgi:hypothetical protein